MGHLLERGHVMSVRTATNATDAFAIIEDSAVDCIVSDSQLPAIDRLVHLETLSE